MDLSTIDPVKDSENGAWVHFVDPRTGELLMDGATPCRVHIFGPLSKVAQDASAAVNAEKERREAERSTTLEGAELKAAKKKERQVLAREGIHVDADGSYIKRGTSTAEELDADNARMYAAITDKWEGIEQGGSTALTPESALAFYSEVKWAGAQVLRKFSDIANFIQGRANS